MSFSLHISACTTLALFTATTLPLPPNYKTTFDNPDLLVMRVHYGPHEVVPMHDHTAYPTVYVYLNNSGVIEISHEGPHGEVLKRPPTHTGAFRIAPGVTERHSITNLSDIPSDFLRIELKRIPLSDIANAIRGDAPQLPTPGTHSEFSDKALRVDRINCTPGADCTIADSDARSLLVAIYPTHLQTPTGDRTLQPGEVLWIPAHQKGTLQLRPATQCLRISLLYP